MLRWMTFFVTGQTEQVSCLQSVQCSSEYTARVRSWSPAVRPVQCTLLMSTRSLPNVLQLHQYADDCHLCDDVCWRCLAGCRSPSSVRVRRWRLDEFASVTSQLLDDSGDLAGAQQPDRQNQYQERRSAIVVCQCRRQRTRPRCGDWQQINDVWSRHCAVRSGGLAITSFGSCDQWPEHFLKQRPRA